MIFHFRMAKKCSSFVLQVGNMAVRPIHLHTAVGACNGLLIDLTRFHVLWFWLCSVQYWVIQKFFVGGACYASVDISINLTLNSKAFFSSNWHKPNEHFYYSFFFLVSAYFSNNFDFIRLTFSYSIMLWSIFS